MIPEAKAIVIDKISVKDFLEKTREKLNLELIAGQEGLNRMIGEKSLNRPALALTKYFKSFANKRVQVFGAGEMSYLNDQDEAVQLDVLTEMAKRDIPCMVISRNLTPCDAMIQVADRFHIPLLRTTMKSKNFATDATVLLDEFFAPQVMVHGTLLDIKGIGVLIRGDSGVGKSECALALIEKGYSLVADDTTYISLLRDQELIGTSSMLNRGYMECRGIGIINIADLFGIRAVRTKKEIDLVITFVIWEQGMDEERTGLEESFYEILRKPIPHMEIPVRPGRDMARLVEVAAMVYALKAIGHDSAKEFNERLIQYMSRSTHES
jgi:HPr kinase/phosphorylase